LAGQRTTRAIPNRSDAPFGIEARIAVCFYASLNAKMWNLQRCCLV